MVLPCLLAAMTHEAATATRSVQEQEWLENAAPLTADEIRSTSRAAQSIADLLEEAESVA